MGAGGGVEGKGAEGGERRVEAGDGEVARDAGGDEGAIGEPLEVADCRVDGRAAIYVEGSGWPGLGENGCEDGE